MPETLDTPAHGHGAYTSIARGLSGLSAAALSVLLLAYPLVLSTPGAPLSHSGVSILLSGIGGTWAHALGYRPRARLSRLWMHPACAWSSMAVGFLLCWR